MDIYISGAERTLEKERYVDTSFPYFFENTQIMIRYPEVSHKSSAFHSIYSTKVNKFNINKYKINNNSLSDLLGVGVHFVYRLDNYCLHALFGQEETFLLRKSI